MNLSKICRILLTSSVCLFSGQMALAAGPIPWPHGQSSQPLSKRIEPPVGFTRLPVGDKSFGSWLRQLPILPGRPQVLLHDGRPKGNQQAHHLVLDIDVGKNDLQQCADAVMRLRAEYLWAQGRYKDICFRFTSGDKHPWSKWAAGLRPKVAGNQVSWHKASTTLDNGYRNFRAYLQNLFIWAGSHSLQKELKQLAEPTKIEPGDVFIQGGFPGHAVIVADVAQNEKNERVFLLIQSYMPAQQMHVLRNPTSEQSPWYLAKKSGTLLTPEWTFSVDDLHRFVDRGCP